MFSEENIDWWFLFRNHQKKILVYPIAGSFSLLKKEGFISAF
jgi:hypothetical protein